MLCTALLCLRNAKAGGHSSWCSSITVHNEVLRRRPDLARVLAGPWFFDRKGEVPAGKQGFFELPVFNYYQACPAASDVLFPSILQPQTFNLVKCHEDVNFDLWEEVTRGHTYISLKGISLQSGGSQVLKGCCLYSMQLVNKVR